MKRTVWFGCLLKMVSKAEVEDVVRLMQSSDAAPGRRQCPSWTVTRGRVWSVVRVKQVGSHERRGRA